MITSTDGQSPYHTLIGTNGASQPRELALTTTDTNRGDVNKSGVNRSEIEAKAETEGDFSFFGEDGFTFGDLIDVVNPLQHIPFVSTMYREASEDDIAAAPRVMGSTLFFGPLGLASALINVMVEESTGKDVGEHVVNALFDEETTDTDTELADVSSFKSAAGTSNPSNEDMDPVSAWAAGEMAWIKSQQTVRPQASRAPSTSAIPDADLFLQGRQDEMATMTPRAAANAARAASWAYESAENLAQLRA